MPLDDQDDRPRPYSISQLNRKIKWLFEERVPQLWVVGEISNLSRARSGHQYFRLKDQRAEVGAVIWRDNRELLEFELKEGMEVLARCRVTLYEQRGQYQLEVQHLEQRGLGKLRQHFLQTKARLEKAGLFDPARKKPLPPFPRRVALVTSPVGAAVRDMIKSITSRCDTEILIYPVRVQGHGAGVEIAEAVRDLNISRPDVELMILGRGGGNIEDLWAFNEEPLARAIASSVIPVVSAVGHEVDRTISDLVADRAVPTPTAVGQVFPDTKETQRKLRLARRRIDMAVAGATSRLRRRLDGIAVRRVITDPLTPLHQRSQRLDELTGRLDRCVGQLVVRRRERLDQLSRRRVLTDPLAPVAILRERVDGARDRIGAALRRHVERTSDRLAALSGKLDALSPLRVLARGYSLTRRDGEVLRRWDQIAVGDRIHTRLAEGSVRSTVTETEEP